MIRALLLILIGAVTGILFTCTYTGTLIRDNLILAVDDLTYTESPSKLDVQANELDVKAHDWLLKTFPKLNIYGGAGELK